MARTVDSAFSQLADTLVPSDAESAAASSHRLSIESCLKANFNMTAFFRTGSFGHGTSCRWYSDVDYFAVIPPENLNKSSNVTLRDIKESLKTRFPRTDIGIRSPAIVVPFGNVGSERHEITPCYRLVNDEGGFVVYGIPDRYDGWMKSSPRAHNSWVNEVNDQLLKKAKPVIRMVKFWNYVQDAGIRSFYLELRVAEYLRGETSVIYQYDMKRALAHLVRKNLASMQDPQGISGMIYPCSDAKKAAALSKLSTALTRAEKAMEAEQNSNIIDAFYWWNMVFGGCFPSYG